MNREARPDAVPPEHADFTGLHAVIWMSVAFFLTLAGMLLLVALRPGVQQDLVSLAIVSSAAFLLTAALLLGRYPAGPRLADGLGARSTHSALVPLGLVLGILAQVPATLIERIVANFWPMSEEEHLARTALFQFDGLGHGIIMILTVACLVPLAEEALFRGAIYGALRRSRRTSVRAATITSIGFAVAHLDLRMLPAILVVAAMLGFMRASSGSLLPGLAAHVGFNGVTMVGLVTGWVPTTGLELPVTAQITSGLCLAVGLLGFAWLSRASPRAAQSRQLEEQVTAYE